MTKKIYFLMIAISVISVSRVSAYPTSGDVGAGVLVGSPIGPTLKFWRSRTQAIDVGLGWGSDLTVYADYDWQSWTIFNQPQQGKLGGYLALGGRLENESDDIAKFGIRTMGGLDYWLSKQPIEIYFELGPVFELTSDPSVDLDGGVGLRYYFTTNKKYP